MPVVVPMRMIVLMVMLVPVWVTVPMLMRVVLPATRLACRRAMAVRLVFCRCRSRQTSGIRGVGHVNSWFPDLC